MAEKFDTLIIGAGPAGCSAAIYAARAGLRVALFESTSPGGQVGQTFEVENYPGILTAEGFSLAMKFAEHAEAAGARVIYGEASGIDVSGEVKALTANGTRYEAASVIIASGAKRRRLGVDGEDRLTGRGVSYCATCDGNFFKGKDVVVAGGGNTAVEDAIYLARLCRTVTVVHRRSEFRATKNLVDRMKAETNVIIRTPATIKAINGAESVESVTLGTENGEETLIVSGIFIAAGTLPETELLKNFDGVKLDASGAVITDEYCRVGIKGVFAVGDVRSKPLRQIVTAAADGAIAGFAVGNGIL